MAELHPGSFVGDSVEEFKKLPTWGKFAAIGVLIVVGYLAYRAKSASTTAQQAAASTASTDPLGSTGAATTGTQSPFPMVGSLPVLPNNVNPIFDSSGNPIAYQQAPNAPTGTTSSTGTTTSPTGTTTGTSNSSGNPLIPFGQYKGPSYSNLKPGTTYTYNNVKYTLNTGPGGKLYGTSGGKQVLLYGPQSMYKAGSDAPNYHTISFMENPLVYFISAKPHTPSSVG